MFLIFTRSRYLSDCCSQLHCFYFFFFNDTAPPEIYTLSLHDALPILLSAGMLFAFASAMIVRSRGLESGSPPPARAATEIGSTRLNSSHPSISYAVFCLKKKT